VETFTATDYMDDTPAWAIYGCEEGGFDPVETRFLSFSRSRFGHEEFIHCVRVCVVFVFRWRRKQKVKKPRPEIELEA